MCLQKPCTQYPSSRRMGNQAGNLALGDACKTMACNSRCISKCLSDENGHPQEEAAKLSTFYMDETILQDEVMIKMDPEDYAAASQYDTGKPHDELRMPIEIELARTGNNWRTFGFIATPDDDPRFLVIDEIWEPSLVSEYNARSSYERRVNAGDLIIAVNGSMQHSKEMLKTIMNTERGCSVRLRILHIPNEI
mmetsp:Transcript_149370/g.263679  ORF Transcript_149370/g.263679 Transcript_149370/m.263679 type:complete len:194 (-) Transcript_149370:138-719(-)